MMAEGDRCYCVKREDCLCGKPATHIAHLPSGNIFAGLREITLEHPVCDYHADKARKLGYEVEVLP